MSGTTPRMLGLWGTLGSLGLAVVLLPVNPTWAQKTEEKREVRVIVKTDDDASDSADKVATIVNDSPVELTAVVTAVEAADPGRINVVVNSDDSASVIAASSLEEAIKKLNEQIKEIAKKSPQSDKDKARQKALESALKELKSAVGKIKDSDAVGDKAKLQQNVRRVVVRHVEDIQKMSAEAKAEIDKASAKVKELAQELQSKQKELREAQHKLSQLQGKLRAATVVARVNTSEMKPHDLTVAPMGRMGVMTSPNTVERRATVRRDADGGQKRIDELEKKLEKLLEEVSALKKDRAK